jgi:arylsulfatase
VFVYNFVDIERFCREGSEALAPRKHTVVFDFKSAGPGFGKGAAGVLSVHGIEVANKTIPHIIPTLMPWNETFDVGVDTRTGVDDADYQIPFAFTEKIDKLTVALEPQG